MNIKNDKTPVFIVGIPRSGTTLLAAMLAAHKRLSCGPETRFFRLLAKTHPHELFKSWPDHAVNFLFNITLVKSVPEHYGLTKDQLNSYLLNRETSIPVILSSLTEQYMKREGKDRWVEKSPEHILFVDDIRKYFPQSPIIRILRDPRDTVLSMIKTPWAPHDFVAALFYWRNFDEKSSHFFQSDDKCYTLFYEDLVHSPETEIKKLCEFIGEEYQPQMLITQHSAANVATKDEPWKRLVFHDLDSSRASVWKREFKDGQNRIAEALIGDRITAYGYERVESFQRTASIFPSVKSLKKYRRSLAYFVEDGNQFWGNAQDVKNQTLIFVGEPDRDKWLSYQKPGRWWDTLHIINKIVKGRLAHQHIYWVQDQDFPAKLGFCSRMLAIVFRFTAEGQVTLD